LVTAPYKNGTNSLRWSWTSSATTLQVNYSVSAANWRDGVIFWVYNETPTTTPLRCEYRSTSGAVQYYFNFGLNFTGWRICRIGTAYMSGNKSISSGLKLYMVSPSGVSSGRLFIDRFSFVSDVDASNAPDQQLPTNNTDLTDHWGQIWRWESTLNYSTAVKTSLSTAEQTSMAAVLTGISGTVPSKANATTIASANTLYNSAAISTVNGFMVGAPFVVTDDKKTGDISFSDIGTMLLGFAEDYLYNAVATSKDKFMTVWDYAQNQGFAYGSSMGKNDHYGYNTRDIFSAMFLMRAELKNTGRLAEAVATLSYWSGLPESRVAYDVSRPGVVDCWNTLMMPRLIAAAMIDSETF
jgi:chondroitin-sulfate-ABC endolyase/exolyase